MEISDVKRRVVEAIDGAKRGAADRRTRVDEATKAYDAFLNRIAVPMFRQIANVLKAESYPFSVFTPGASVRLVSERAADDYIELALDTSGDEPTVSGHVRRSRGRRVLESERALGDPAALTEHDVLSFVVKELEPFVDR